MKIVMQSWKRLWFYKVNEPKFDLANITNGFILKGEEKYTILKLMKEK